ncbi:MAG: helix-turn-helix transcriptional regulator [Lentisphaeria bacterium]|nr:helix-turn-helix transcriptional regulator [Lentisphaeria bacterium]
MAKSGGVELRLAFNGTSRPKQDGWTAHGTGASWVLDVITKGEQTQRVGSGKLFLRPNALLALYAPGTNYYELQRHGNTMEEAYMVFEVSQATIAEALKELTGDEGYCHIEDPAAVAASRLQRLGTMFSERPRGTEFLASALMLEVLGRIYTSSIVGPHRRTLAPTGNDPVKRLIERVSEYLDEHLAEPVQVADLARYVGMSTSTFAHAYPVAAGDTPYNAVVRHKVNAAKRLLLGEGLTVKETAGRLGFSSEFNFSRTFKRVEGVAPGKYVQRLRARRTG